VQCPHCQSENSGIDCPTCGPIPADPENRLPQRENSESDPHSVSPSQLVTKPQTGTADWRSQVKRKVSERTGKNLAPNEGLHQLKGPSRATHKSGSAGRPLFDYQLSEPHKHKKTRKPKVVRFPSKGNYSPTIAERPLIRSPVSSQGNARPQLPKQQALTLDAPLAPPVIFSPVSGKRGDSTEIGVSHEVILSRLLAGMIDLVFSFLIAFVFTVSASYVLNFELISTSSVRLGVLFSLCFFFLNAFFFLILSGQTPGMYLTDLQLVGEESEEVSFPSLVLRVFLFLPVAATVLGLCICVGDPWCRCAHDRVSKTRIIPIKPENVPSPGQA
jgi:uncharacterized RDD family membrane protein YckC